MFLTAVPLFQQFYFCLASRFVRETKFVAAELVNSDRLVYHATCVVGCTRLSLDLAVAPVKIGPFMRLLIDRKVVSVLLTKLAVRG